MTSGDNPRKPRQGAWARACELAELTPESRNRYVDFLRALSILAVVLGHWLMAAPHFDDGARRLDHMLGFAPWTQWLTWVFQVMPVFFFVGGYANATSWRSARRRGVGYGPWLDSRLRRLLGPVLPLLVVWALMAAVAQRLGVPAAMVKVGSQVALVPTWFLAVYILVVLMVPASHAAWQRFGLASLWALVAGAILVDLAFWQGLRALGWANYLFVWLAVHQLGYAWLDGRLSGPRRALPWLLLGLPALLALALIGPYPLSLVGVPDDEVSNTLPPKLPLLALGLAQIGLLLALEGPLRRWLARRVPWSATVLVNGSIMTVFLWHSTVMMLLIGAGFWLAPMVFDPRPASAEWWLERPLWIAAYALACMPFLAAFARFERSRASASPTPVAAWRQLAGCALACAGLAFLALDGVAGSDWGGLRLLPLLLPFVGAGLAGFGPLGGLSRLTSRPSAPVPASDRAGGE